MLRTKKTRYCRASGNMVEASTLFLPAPSALDITGLNYFPAALNHIDAIKKEFGRIKPLNPLPVMAA
jgi:hypothetical protein